MSASTITPTTIDAFVRVESVWLTDRHRRDLGNLDELAKSIDDVGLLNPITLTREARLVAGQRRLEACRRLGWTEIPVRFIDSLDDASRLLRAERDENTCRKDMLPSEKASLGEALYEIAAHEAKQRQREHGYTAPGRPAQNTSSSIEGSVQDGGVETAAIVGEALGIGKTNYYELRFIYKTAKNLDLPNDERELADKALAEIDSRGAIQPMARRLRGQLRAKRDAREATANPAVMPDAPSETAVDEVWIPPRTDSTQRATEQRRKLITQYAARGYSSYQIGEKIAILPVTVRRIARADGIPIPADQAMGRGSRRCRDQQRRAGRSETPVLVAGRQLTGRRGLPDSPGQPAGDQTRKGAISVNDTVQTQHYRIEERMAADGQITALHVLGHAYDDDPELAWLKFRLETYRHHYTPHSLRRLVLIGSPR